MNFSKVRLIHAHTWDRYEINTFHFHPFDQLEINKIAENVWRENKWFNQGGNGGSRLATDQDDWEWKDYIRESKRKHVKTFWKRDENGLTQVSEWVNESGIVTNKSLRELRWSPGNHTHPNRRMYFSTKRRGSVYVMACREGSSRAAAAAAVLILIMSLLFVVRYFARTLFSSLTDLLTGFHPPYQRHTWPSLSLFYSRSHNCRSNACVSSSCFMRCTCSEREDDVCRE